jgi:hypothetical protein
MRVKITQIIEGEVTLDLIERYMIRKKWTLSGGQYRSPCSRYGLSLGDGEQMLLNELASIEGRCSNAVYLDVVGNG